MARKGKNNNQKNRQQAAPAPSNALTQYGIDGNFGGQAYSNARSAGMSVDQIRALAPGSGLKIGAGPQAALNPGQFDQGYTPEAYAENPYSVVGRGMYGGGLPSQDGNSYGLDPYIVPGATNGIGPNKNVLFRAGPGGDYAENQAKMNEWYGVGGRYYGGDKGGSAAATPGASSSGQSAGATESQVKNVGYRAAMADGKIGRKDIRAYMDEKGIKGNQQSNAQMRIADRWSSKKGARLGRGVLQDYMGNYENKNPFIADWNRAELGGKTANTGALGSGTRTGFGNLSGYMTGKTKSRNDLYRAANNILTNKNYAKGDVFARLRDGTIRGETRMGGTNTKRPGATTTETQSTTTSTTPGPVGTVDNGPMNQLQQDYADAGAMGPGGLYGGGAGGRGASRMRKARSRQQRLGIRGAGTTINNRTSPFFTALNNR